MDYKTLTKKLTHRLTGNVCERTFRCYKDGRIYQESYERKVEDGYKRKAKTKGFFIKFTPVYKKWKNKNYKGDPSRGYWEIHMNQFKKVFKVHRLMAEAWFPDFDPKLPVDHIDGDGWNNNLDNLRQITNSENARAFRAKAKNKTSKYRGVSKYPNKRGLKKCWVTHPLVANGKQLASSRYFYTELEAAYYWNAMALKNGWAPEALNDLPEPGQLTLDL